MDILGFDFNWNKMIYNNFLLFPQFEREVLEVHEDGSQVVKDNLGLITLEKPGVSSIPSDIGTYLSGRDVWEKEYLPRLQFSQERVNIQALKSAKKPEDRKYPLGLFCGSLIGTVRDLLGVTHFSYLFADDYDLMVEIVATFAKLSHQVIKYCLEQGVSFDYAHYWEDICFKNGPLVMPDFFDEIVGPHYKRNTELLNSYNVDIISLDCDGLIDHLIPTWINNGVNTMFPIEVGTWNASILPWREKYGKNLLGVGGMNKNVFSKDRQAVDKEIERLKPLIALGGFIPCPDHRIAPDAKFELVQYYCSQLRKI